MRFLPDELPSLKEEWVSKVDYPEVNDDFLDLRTDPAIFRAQLVSDRPLTEVTIKDSLSGDSTTWSDGELYPRDP